MDILKGLRQSRLLRQRAPRNDSLEDCGNTDKMRIVGYDAKLADQSWIGYDTRLSIW